MSFYYCSIRAAIKVVQKDKCHWQSKHKPVKEIYSVALFSSYLLFPFGDLQGDSFKAILNNKILSHFIIKGHNEPNMNP